MSRAAEKLLSEALKLPDEERASLVAEILKTLPPATPGLERGDEEWLAEVERRAREALAGGPGVPWEEAVARARSKLRGQ